MRLFQVQAPGSLTCCAPGWFSCWSMQTKAPVGSWSTAIRPESFGRSTGPKWTWPPASFTLSAVSSASSTLM